MKTDQTEFWESDFGQKYTDRNTYDSLREWDQRSIDKFGISRLSIFKDFIGDLDREARILEVGCNTGMQLLGLQSLGFKNLYGIELQWYAVKKAHQLSKEINIIQGSGFDIPFKDGYFDLVMTNGVLIHINPDHLNAFMSEVYRCSNNYIMGYEYFAEQMTPIDYRGNEGFLWKSNYMKHYLDNFDNLRLVKSKFYDYLSAANLGNKDQQFLLSKKQEI